MDKKLDEVMTETKRYCEDGQEEAIKAILELTNGLRDALNSRDRYGMSLSHLGTRLKALRGFFRSQGILAQLEKTFGYVVGKFGDNADLRTSIDAGMKKSEHDVVDLLDKIAETCQAAKLEIGPSGAIHAVRERMQKLERQVNELQGSVHDWRFHNRLLWQLRGGTLRA